MAHVVVKVGKSQVESVITRRSAEELDLKKGDMVKVGHQVHGSDAGRRN